MEAALNMRLHKKQPRSLVRGSASWEDIYHAEASMQDRASLHIGT
jgi:hypothetical protein